MQRTHSIASHQRNKMAAAVTLVAAMTAEPVLAQIEEIVVTSQRRAESVQEVPISITAMDRSTLEKLNITKPTDIAAQTPNLRMANSNFGESAPVIGIRGITNADFSAISNTPVSVYSDGVVLNNIQLHGMALFDTDRIEVLRGPQGTLFGRNSTSGALQFISAKPSDELEFGGQATIGKFNKQRIEAYTSGAILGDKLRGRIAIASDTSDGWVEEAETGKDVQGTDNKSARLTLDSQVTDKLFAEFRFQHQKIDGDDIVFHNSKADNNQLGLIDTVNATGTKPNIPVPTTQGGAAKDFSKVSLDDSFKGEEADSSLASLKLNYDFGDITLTSITGFVDHEHETRNDIDSSRVSEFSYQYANTEQKQFSQEFRLAGVNGRFDWVTGVYFFDENVKGDASFSLSDISHSVDLRTDPSQTPFSVFTQLTSDPTTFLPIGNNTARRNTSDQDLTSTSVFGHTKITLTDKWSATLGLRWTRDEKDITQFANTCLIYDTDNGGALDKPETFISRDDLQAVPGFEYCGARTEKASDAWEAFTGRASIEYTPTDDLLTYASISRGFKGGGYTGIPEINLSTGEYGFSDVDSEFVLAYEIGAKASWLDRRLITNLSYFYNDYEDFQDQQVEIQTGPFGSSGSVFLRNIPKVRLQGMELEVNAEPVDNMFVNFGLAYLDTEITEGNRPDVDGNELRFAPQWTANFVLGYSFDIGALGLLTPQIDGNWTDNYYVDTKNTQSAEIGDKGILNARLRWDHSEGKIWVTAFVENINDSTVITSSLPAFYESYGSDNATVDAPRTYGLTIGANF